ncbi:hypothetical protein MRQ36_28120 [Micromonospora sp. R77]|nr:hypothetical protein [Micromonospora sp. R77]MCI4066207.1 hypothetical protein [Micromonospora sp. R77]
MRSGLHPDRQYTSPELAECGSTRSWSAGSRAVTQPGKTSDRLSPSASR